MSSGAGRHQAPQTGTQRPSAHKAIDYRSGVGNGHLTRCGDFAVTWRALRARSRAREARACRPVGQPSTSFCLHVCCV